MIIIDGPDHVGKTTLAKALANVLPITYRHLSKLHNRFDPYWDYVPMMDRCVLMDRFYDSRTAYGIALQNQLPLDTFHMDLLDAHAKLHGAIRVLVYIENPTTYYEKAEWGDWEMYSKEQSIRVANQFIALKHERPWDFKWASDVIFPTKALVTDICDRWRKTQHWLCVLHDRKPFGRL